MSEKKGLELLAEMTADCFVPPSAILNRLTGAERAVILAAKEWRAVRFGSVCECGDSKCATDAVLRAAVDELMRVEE